MAVRARLSFILAVTLAVPAAFATQVQRLSLEETVRQADVIAIGTVTARESRWGDVSRRTMLTDFTFEVEEVLHAPNAPAATITLTYWGGTIDGKTQAISDLRLPVVGERLLVMLRPGWQRRDSGSSFTPMVGFDQGFFSIAPRVAGEAPLVVDTKGQPLARAASGQVMRREQTDAATVDVATFKTWLRENIGRIKASRSELQAAVNADDPRILKTFSARPEFPGSAPPDPTGYNSNAVPPNKYTSGPTAGIPNKSGGATAPPSRFLTETTSRRSLTAKPEYSSSHQAHLPIVINQFPSSFAPWSPEDQYQMSNWNYYADVFRVFVSPTGTYGWGNGRFDLAGWPSSADLQSVYGSGWGANVIGVCFLQWDGGGWITEADIALNPAFSFTLDDEWVLDGSPAQGFRQVMSHELGHMHGLEHNFNYLSLMNYMPSKFRFYSLPYADDAEGVRAEYPGAAISRTDLAVYLYYSSGFQSVSDATIPAIISPGAQLSVNDYHVENVGTTTISTPTIDWYLTSQRNYFGSYYYVGTSTYSSLAPFTYFTPSTVQRTFTVPSLPSGYYYLGTYIPGGDGGPFAVGFPFDNNYAFSSDVVYVCPGITATSNTPVCTGGNLQLNASLVSGSSYSWTGPNGFTSNAQNPTLTSVSASAAGFYTATATLNSCAPVASTLVVVSPLNAPVGVSATALAPTSVYVAWDPLSCNATYDVYRSASGTSYTKIASTSSTNYTDNTAQANKSYLYAVKAVAAGTLVASAYSAPDLVSTVAFTDATLTALSTRVKAIHITELRTAINAMRTLAGLGAATFSDPTLTAGMTVERVHITELRTALNAARSALGLSAISYTDSSVTAGVTTAKTEHLDELRNGLQ